MVSNREYWYCAKSVLLESGILFMLSLRFLFSSQVFSEPSNFILLCLLEPVQHFRTCGADSTDLVDVQVPEHGFARQGLYLGRGAGAVSGTIVAAPNGKPLAGAQVRILGGPETRASARHAEA